MDYLTIYGAAHDQAFQSRCKVAMWRAAQDIAAEPADTPDHATRNEWAKRVLQDVVAIKPHVLAMQVLRNPQIAANPGAAPDRDLQYQVNSEIGSIIAIG
jgi:hypothetical protein